MTQDDILSALNRILATEDFRKSDRATGFLRYVVTQDLAGNSSHLQGTTIAQDVFDRDETFDPNADPIVRVQAGRVRKLLEAYYSGSGQADPLRIDIPKGGYVPRYTGRDPQLSKPASSDPGIKEDTAKPAWRLLIAHPPTMIIGLLLTVLIFVGVQRFTQLPENSAASIAPAGPKIYVQQFTYAGDPKLEVLLKSGFQIELIDRLSRFRELFVYGPDAPYLTNQDTTALNPATSGVTPDFLLSGSIEYFGDRINITGQLVEVATSSIVWSQNYSDVSAQAVKIAEVKSSIAGDVAASLGQPYGVIQTFLGQKLIGAPELTFNDYLCVLRFREYARAKSANAHSTVRDCLEQAVTDSPNFSVGWAALSWAYGDEIRYGFNPKSGDTPADERSLTAAKKAVATDPFNAMAHLYLGEALMLRGNDQAYLRSVRRSLELNPNDSEALASFAWNAALIDNSSEARQMAEKAIELNPGHPPWYHGGLAIHFYRIGNYDQAHFHAERFYADGSALSQILLIGACSRTGHDAQSAETWSKLRSSHPEVTDAPAKTLRIRQFPDVLVEKLVADIEKASRYSLEAM